MLRRHPLESGFLHVSTVMVFSVHSVEISLDPDAFDGGTKEGRIALPDWHKYGYISPVYSRSVSRSIILDIANYEVSSDSPLPGLLNTLRMTSGSIKWRKGWEILQMRPSI
jgi:hypothetical protein